MNSFLPWILAALQLPKKNSFRGNYSRIYGSRDQNLQKRIIVATTIHGNTVFNIHQCIDIKYRISNLQLQWLTCVSPFRYRANNKISITKGNLDPTFHVCEYIGGPNLALKQPTFCPDEYSSYPKLQIGWVNDGIFPTISKYWFGDFWHGLGKWVYLQITLDKFYAIKTVIFQSR